MNEVCFIVGFNNPSYFARCFQKQFGILPKDSLSGKYTFSSILTAMRKNTHYNEKKLSLQ
ncbi:MAG: AraC family transcriptional regulator [Bacteroides sp.]|uniref:helix-turn-helix domain-containing protein n=1 Tax=Bacteroides sp. TaxID=29523 RepID=UPI00338E9E40|nr:AraC family transcriptional regulator [Bacteroides sp.]